MTVAAYTPASGYKAYPPYFNARIVGDMVVVTVRCEEDLTGEHPQCGVTASMQVPLASFIEGMALILPGYSIATTAAETGAVGTSGASEQNPITARDGGEAAVQYEVWQDDMLVASSDILSDAQHFAMIYGQDGHLDVIVATTYRVPLAAGGEK